MTLTTRKIVHSNGSLVYFTIIVKRLIKNDCLLFETLCSTGLLKAFNWISRNRAERYVVGCSFCAYYEYKCICSLNGKEGHLEK